MDAVAILAYAAFRSADPQGDNPDTASGATSLASLAEAGAVADAGSGRGDGRLRSGTPPRLPRSRTRRAYMRSRTLFFQIAPRPLRSNRQYIWRGRGPGRSTRRGPERLLSEEAAALPAEGLQPRHREIPMKIPGRHVGRPHHPRRARLCPLCVCPLWRRESNGPVNRR